jgi:hypothetical protein
MKVMLSGDSIRLNDQDRVRATMPGGAQVLGPADNGRGPSPRRQDNR